MGGLSCPPHKKINSLWNRPKSLFFSKELELSQNNLMPYSQFTLQQVIQQFKLNIVEVSTFLPVTNPVSPSSYLTEFLERNFDLALALNTEKADRKSVVCPILLAA